MKMFNMLEVVKFVVGVVGDVVIVECFLIFLCVLNLVVLYIIYVLWQQLGYVQVQGDIFDVVWLQVDVVVLEQSELKLVVQVNGKLCGEVIVLKDVDKVVIEVVVLVNEDVKKFLIGVLKKVIVVLGKLVNIVV